MVCPKIPEAQFDLHSWFHEHFPEPILHLPEKPDEWRLKAMKATGQSIENEWSNYEKEIKQVQHDFNVLEYKWKLVKHKYLEMKNGIKIEVEHGKRVAKFIYLNPLEDGWKSLVTSEVQNNGSYKMMYMNWEESTIKYISSGDWDKHDFSDNERLLAWRIECNTMKPKEEQVQRHGDIWKEEEEYDLMKSFSEYLNNRSEIHERSPSAIKIRIQKILFKI